MRASWPLVGRADELGLLEAALSRDWRGAVLSGSAGVGKTRLAMELVEWAARDGWRTIWVTATRSMSAVMLGAFAHLLPTAGDGPSSTCELLGRLRREIGTLGWDGRVVLCVDDGHLLDEASAAAAHMLATTGTAFVLLTVRSGEPVPDAISALWKDGLAVRVELQSLSRLETGELLTAALGGQVDGVTEHRLWHVTRGNVLFLHELVRAGIDSVQLSCRDRVWSWTGEITCGERLLELIELRLTGLTAAERAVLEVLAVGEPLRPALLGPDRTNILELLERRGLVAVTQDGDRTLVRLAHPLYAESLQAGMGVLRRQAILGELADRLTEQGRLSGGDLVRFVSWRLDSGGEVDVPQLIAAAREVRRRFDHARVEQFARLAISHGGGAEAMLLLADALYWQGRHEDAAAVLDQVQASADDTLPTPAQAWQAILTASNAFWGLNDASGAEQALRDAEHRLEPGAEHAELVAHRASLAMFNGRPTEAITIAESVLTTPQASETSRARALAALIPALAIVGRYQRAIEAAEAGVRLAGGIAPDEPWMLSELLGGQAIAYWLAGRLDDLQHLAEREHTAAISRRDDDLRGLWALLLGQAQFASGRVASARRLFREASTYLRQRDSGGFLSWGLAAHAISATLVGDLTEANQFLVQARQTHRSVIRTHDTELVLAEAWLAAANGERTRAGQLASQAASTAAHRGQHGVAARALHEALRLGVSNLHTRLSVLAQLVDGPIASVYAAHSHALADDDGAGLVDAAERFATQGAVLHAAEAAAQAAQAYDRSGQMAAKLIALDRSRTLASSCEGATTPILRAAADPPALGVLTAREREIAELVARGLTNRCIAERLVLSVRTVGNHLNHIYGKLGVSREDLVLLFRLRTAPPQDK